MWIAAAIDLATVALVHFYPNLLIRNLATIGLLVACLVVKREKIRLVLKACI